MNSFLEIIRRAAGGTRRLGFFLLVLASPSLAADYLVQIGAYRSAANAERAAAAARADGFPVYTEKMNSATGRPLTRIVVGPYPNKAQANEALSRLQGRGIKGFVLAAPPRPEERAVLPGPTAGGEAAQNAAPAAAKRVSPALLPEREAEAPKQERQEAPATVAPAEQSPVPAQGDQEAASGEDFLESLATDETTPRLTGFFQSELAYSWQKPDHFSVFRHTLELRSGGNWGSRAQWRLSGRASYDGVFDLTDYYSPQVENDQRWDAALWETYVDFSAGGWDMRVGRQHIIWGEMVGLFFADVVSAKDLRQFVLPDFDMIRIPQWAVRGEYFRGDFHTELIWIPYPTYDEIGVPGADFYPGPLPPPPGYAQAFRGERKPAGGLDQSGYGLRFSALKAGWDMAGFYYSSMSAEPTFFRQVTASKGVPTLVNSPDHQRIEQVGGTLSKDFSPVVMKAEMVYTHGRSFEVARLSAADGVVSQDYLDYAVGIDYAGWQQSRLNFQLFQRWFPTHDPDLVFKALESGVTLLASTTFAGGKVEPQLLVMTGLDRGDWLARPSVAWHVNANWRLAAGVDVFGGSRRGLFGRFDGQNRAYGELRYTF